MVMMKGYWGNYPISRLLRSDIYLDKRYGWRAVAGGVCLQSVVLGEGSKYLVF